LWAAAYQHALASAGNADGKAFCCDPQLDFCGTCEQRFAVRLGFGDDAATAGGAIQLRGCYCGLPTGGCIAALADTPDGPVGVFVTTSDRDPAPRLPPGSELQLARRELGTLVLYAISRRSQPSAAAPLEQFVLAP
jgi:hypothetical protein